MRFGSTTRVGVIGDVHAEHLRLERALAFLQRKADHILCTGDIADGVGSVDRACEMLQAHTVLCVRGNHDRWLVSNDVRTLNDATRLEDVSESTIAFLSSLPPTRIFETPLGRMILCHGLGENDMAKVTPDDYGYALQVNDAFQELLRDPRFQLVLNGHTHSPMVRHFDGVSLINAGTLRGDSPGVILLDFGTRTVDLFHGFDGPEEPILHASMALSEPE
jgi:putative phosphoesterase